MMKVCRGLCSVMKGMQGTVQCDEGYAGDCSVMKGIQGTVQCDEGYAGDCAV